MGVMLMAYNIIAFDGYLHSSRWITPYLPANNSIAIDE